MPETITYSLRNLQSNSDQYYQDVAVFTDNVIDHTMNIAGETLSRFQNHLSTKALENLRTQSEYILDYLVLGMLYRIYSTATVQMTNPSQRILAWLYQVRQQQRWAKPLIDLIRGFLSGLTVLDNRSGDQFVFSAAQFDLLLKWLQATGDFTEENKRLSLWADFLTTLSSEDQRHCLEQAVNLADWFTTESLIALGKYTPEVDDFLREKHPAYRWREDRFFCGRRREEYHLNMVGTEILNRAFQQEFLNSGTKIVLLPPCMKAKQDGSCQAAASPLGDQCAHCTPGCRIHQVTLLGEKYGFAVSIIPHELSVFSSGKMKTPDTQSVGIVGVSCPLTNVTGGWETSNLGIPAQGVLLDYCGCSWHWHPDGIITDINVKQLLKVIGV